MPIFLSTLSESDHKIGEVGNAYIGFGQVASTLLPSLADQRFKKSIKKKYQKKVSGDCF